MQTDRQAQSGRYLLLLSLTALGVVYGDIGTSPLYAMRECFHGISAVPLTRDNVFGILSLITWALMIVISVKYLIFILRADNHGEGGILALTALVTPLQKDKPRGRRHLLILLGIFGAALLFSDGTITPAISVLSAVEGLNVATPFFQPYVVPLTILILIGIFSIQSRGTGSVGRIFGPITVVWFLALAALGVAQIARHPEVLAAVNPIYAVWFFMDNGVAGFVVLSAVFLVVTGGEALYADMGHFGRRPIRLMWFTLVLPSLLLNYFGQGALLIMNPDAVANPFYNLCPDWALYPMVVLSTAATVIASQALISGAFSLGMQAVQLGYSPRLLINHTSHREYGQVYVPTINWTLMLACIGLVLGFGSSTNLAAAYGVSVTTTMVITAILFSAVARERWKWSLPVVAGLTVLFLVVDLAFWGANLTKIVHGGWFPLAIATVVFSIFTTWKTGRSIIGERIDEHLLPLDELLNDDFSDGLPARVPGLAVFMVRDPNVIPPSLLLNLTHNKVLHERNILLSIKTEEVPYVPDAEMSEFEELRQGFLRVKLRYGYMQTPDVPRGLELANIPNFDPNHATYFLGRETIVVTARPGMAPWRERLFALMSRNARSASRFFRLPPNRVVEIGTQVEL